MQSDSLHESLIRVSTSKGTALLRVAATRRAKLRPATGLCPVPWEERTAALSAGRGGAGHGAQSPGVAQ